MKKIIFFLILAIGVLTSNRASAQVSLSFNVGSQPVWGPTGYDYVDYYYLPDIEAYYYVPQHQFVYLEGNNWVFSSSLPARYGSFDLYSAHKVVINSPKPYMHHDADRAKYATFKGQHDQHVIRDSHESKYYEIKEHPEHSKWQAPKGNAGHEEHHEGHDHGK